MTRSLFLAPVPEDRARPGVGFAVIAAHVGLLFIANLYWPLHTVVESVVVQVFRSDVSANRIPADSNAGATSNGEFARNPGSITTQRFGRAATQLELPSDESAAAPAVPAPPVAQQSTPLLATPQIALEKAVPVPVRTASSAAPIPAAPAVQPAPVVERAVPEAALLPVPAPPLTQPAVTATIAAPTPTPTPTPAPAPAAQVPPAVAPAAVTPRIATPSDAVSVQAVPASATRSTTAVAAPTASAASQAAAATPGAASPSAAGAASAPSANAGQASAGAASGSGAAGSPSGGLQGGGLAPPLNLGLPPRYIYRPPISVPQRSLSEMANEQLRRKPRDPFAEAVDGAANIDCVRDTPEGPAQGLLAVGPLLKRAIEEKCKR